VLSALLLERKLLLLSRVPARLTSAACALLALLWPLQWCHSLAPLLPPNDATHALLGMPFPYLLGHAVSTDGRAPSDVLAAADDDAGDTLVLHLDDGRLCGDRAMYAPLPEREGALLRRRLQAAVAMQRAAASAASEAGADAADAAAHGTAAADAAVQAACFATIASLLGTLVTSDKFASAGSSAAKRTAKRDALDAQASRLTALYVQRQQSESARAFAAGLAEASHFKRLVEEMVQAPRAMWPRSLRLLDAWVARAANEEHLC
jgi:hypothetical protein